MEPLNEGYWNRRFTANDTPWDIGHVSTPLKEYADQLTGKDTAILIPGCGNAYEAEYLVQQGFSHITLVDISPVLTDRLRQKFKAYTGKQLNIVTSDFFELEGQYDLILEQTFFCALDPGLRRSYAEQVHRLLRPGGTVAGILFNRSFDTNPPFGGSATEYRQLFSPLYNLRTLEPCYNSIQPRAGAELFFIAKKNRKFHSSDWMPR
jgi:SAM-dependent methyltransferase